MTAIHLARFLENNIFLAIFVNKSLPATFSRKKKLLVQENYLREISFKNLS